MKSLLTIALFSLTSLSAWAQAAKPCEELKADIAKKLDAKNVKAYSLEIVSALQVKDAQKVVGSCEGGTKKIVYSRTPAPAEQPAHEASKQ